jgi:CheY-like chemotaxis protein
MASAAILVVDDNPVDLSVLRAMLRKDDYDFIAADSGRAALDIVRANPSFDLIVLDVHMGDLNGIEVCRRLKEDPTTRLIPIVLVSGVQTDDPSIKEGMEAGADGYLTKPIETCALRAWVKASLRISRLQRELAMSTDLLNNGNEAFIEALTELPRTVKGSLGAICAAADLLGQSMPEHSPGHDHVAEIISRAEEVAKAVSKLELLAKQGAKA